MLLGIVELEQCGRAAIDDGRIVVIGDGHAAKSRNVEGLTRVRQSAQARFSPAQNAGRRQQHRKRARQHDPQTAPRPLNPHKRCRRNRDESDELARTSLESHRVRPQRRKCRLSDASVLLHLSF
jgi:hypothetical protein